MRERRSRASTASTSSTASANVPPLGQLRDAVEAQRAAGQLLRVEDETRTTSPKASVAIAR